MNPPVPSTARSHALGGALLGWAGRLLVGLLIGTAAVGCADVPPPAERPVTRAFDASGRTPLGILVEQRRTRQGARSDSAFVLLESVDSALSSRLALAEGAVRSLDLQYYAIHADASTELLLQRIREAARRGVRVRILLDDFNAVGDDAQVLRLAFEPNVEMRLFNPLPGSRRSLFARLLAALPDFHASQKRMHNKLFIADNAWGITGGRNLGDAYFGADGDSNFVDLDILAAGGIVRYMSDSFDRYWNDPLAYRAQELLEPGELERMRDTVKVTDTKHGATPDPKEATAPRPPRQEDPHAILPDVPAHARQQEDRAPMDLSRAPLVWAPSALMVDRPGKIAATDDPKDTRETVVAGLLSLLETAREEVLVMSPYFVPGAEMMRSFAALRARGVRVRVLTNSLASNDAPAAHAGYARYRRDLLRMGVEVHEMRAARETAVGLEGGAAPRDPPPRPRGWPGIGGSQSAGSHASLHSKAVVIDRSLSVIGSMNLDLRSKLQNSEVALLVRSRVLAEQAARMIEHSFERSAYRLVMENGRLHWKAPPGAAFADATTEPEASLVLRLLVRVLGPLAPEEML